MLLLLKKNVVFTFVVYFDETVFNDCNETTNETEWQNYDDSKKKDVTMNKELSKSKKKRKQHVFNISFRFCVCVCVNNVLVYSIYCNIAGCLSTICIDLLTLWSKQIYKCVECWIWNTSLLCIIMHTEYIDAHTRSFSYIYTASNSILFQFIRLYIFFFIRLILPFAIALKHWAKLIGSIVLSHTKFIRMLFLLNIEPFSFLPLGFCLFSYSNSLLNFHQFLHYI